MYIYGYIYIYIYTYTSIHVYVTLTPLPRAAKSTAPLPVQSLLNPSITSLPSITKVIGAIRRNANTVLIAKRSVYLCVCVRHDSPTYVDRRHQVLIMIGDMTRPLMLIGDLKC